MTANDAVSIRSRFKDTPVFPGPSGPRYGLLEVPPEFADLLPADFRLYRVEPGDEGFPDRIAAAVFGDGCEDLWWAVMLANGIVDPETELWAGRIIRVPPRYAVQAFLSRA